MNERDNEQTRELSGTAQRVAGKTSDHRATIPVLDGQCITKTLPRIRSMPPDALVKVRSQAEDLITQVLEIYERDIAPGEVGYEGSAIADDRPANDLGPTGLLYGRIQSGKTAAMITFTALAIDNGFRIVIVLTTNFLELVRQTKDRFNDLARVLVRASTEPEEWSADLEVDHLRKTVPDRGLVLICAKHPGHLQNVLDLLNKIGGQNYPALILDDEADQASLDNNERKRSQATAPELVAATAVNQAILDIRKKLRHHVFLQVTATPYALLLQRANSPHRPKFTFLLDPGIGYTGGESFFSLDHVSGRQPTGEPPIIFVGEEESKEIESGPKNPPRGLENAITYFLVAAAAQAIMNPDVLDRSQNFLCHTSHKKAEHDKLHNLVVSFTSSIRDELDPLRGRTEGLMNWAYSELKKTVPELPSLREVLDDIIDRLPRRKVRIVNSEGKSGEEVRGAPNFIIGGNILGRGLTIPNLLVTYYVRKPRISQMDTMLQHARMFGYRTELMPYTRVFLPRSLAVRFWAIHEAEQELRDLLRTADALEQIPVQVVGELRVTRYGVLDTGSVVTLSSGKHLYPTYPDTDVSSRDMKRIESLSRRIWTEWHDGRSIPASLVSLQTIEELVRVLAPSEWDQSALSMVMRSLAGDDGRIYAAYRPMDRGKNRLAEHRDLATGALSGDELREARARPLPTFFLFRQTTPRLCWSNARFFYPTIVFPLSMANQIYNDSTLD